jgi:hypothetical protein
VPRHQILPHDAVSFASLTGDSYVTKAIEFALVARGGEDLIVLHEQRRDLTFRRLQQQRVATVVRD